MSWSTLLPFLSIVALVSAFLQVIAKPEPDKGKWKIIVALAALSLLVSGAAEVGKRSAELSREKAEQLREAEQRAFSQQLLTDVRGLNELAARSFHDLDRTLKSLPAPLAAPIAEEAGRVQVQLNQLNQEAAVDTAHTSAARLRDLVETTTASLHRLDTVIESQRKKQLLQGTPPEHSGDVQRAGDAAEPPKEPAVGNLVPSVGIPRSVGGSASALNAPVPTSGKQSAFRHEAPRPRPTISLPLLIEDEGFVPSGYMGEESLAVERTSADHHSSPDCMRLTYTPYKGKPFGWAAVAWQFPENNWGDKQGKDWSKRGFNQVSVWARANPDRRGRLPRVTFRAGGHVTGAARYRASFEVEGRPVQLGEKWTRYSLDLNGKDLAQVIAAFVVVIDTALISEVTTIYLDDIQYQ